MQFSVETCVGIEGQTSLSHWRALQHNNSYPGIMLKLFIIKPEIWNISSSYLQINSLIFHTYDEQELKNAHTHSACTDEDIKIEIFHNPQDYNGMWPYRKHA